MSEIGVAEISRRDNQQQWRKKPVEENSDAAVATGYL